MALVLFSSDESIRAEYDALHPAIEERWTAYRRALRAAQVRDDTPEQAVRSESKAYMKSQEVVHGLAELQIGPQDGSITRLIRQHVYAAYDSNVVAPGKVKLEDGLEVSKKLHSEICPFKVKGDDLDTSVVSDTNMEGDLECGTDTVGSQPWEGSEECCNDDPKLEEEMMEDE